MTNDERETILREVDNVLTHGYGQVLVKVHQGAIADIEATRKVQVKTKK